MVDNTFRAYTRPSHISFNHLFNFQIKFGSPTHISICINAAVYYNDTVLKYVIFCFNFIVLSVPSVYSRYKFTWKMRAHTILPLQKGHFLPFSHLNYSELSCSPRIFLFVCNIFVKPTTTTALTYQLWYCLIQFKMEEPYHLVIATDWKCWHTHAHMQWIEHTNRTSLYPSESNGWTNVNIKASIYYFAWLAI